MWKLLILLGLSYLFNVISGEELGYIKLEEDSNLIFYNGVPNNQTNLVVTGNFRNAVNSTGWALLQITTNETHNDRFQVSSSSTSSSSALRFWPTLGRSSWPS